MRLQKTRSGNWAKSATITGGGKWRFCGNFGTLKAAQAAAGVHERAGRRVQVTEETTSKSQYSKQRKLAKNYQGGVYVGPVVGGKFFRLEAYITRGREVMRHATAAECAAAGVWAGPMNG